MKKYLLILALACLAFLPLGTGGSLAQAEGWAVPALISDADPSGTNLRAAPSGSVAAVLPFTPGPRIVLVAQDSQKGWFRVKPFPVEGYELEGVATVPAEGWMHGSVLALCACGSEDGDPWLYTAPSWDAGADVQVAECSPLRPLEIRGEWLKVRTVKDGRSVDRWMHAQQAAASVLDLFECQARLVKGWRK